MNLIKRFWKGLSIVSAIVAGIAIVAAFILYPHDRSVPLLAAFIAWYLVMPFLVGLFGESPRQSAQELQGPAWRRWWRRMTWGG